MKKEPKHKAAVPYHGMPINVATDNGTAFSAPTLMLAVASLANGAGTSLARDNVPGAVA